jgi:hypothetical protein
MIEPYINKLIENLPDTIKNTKKPLKLDLVLDGGLFNGSYLVGALYFIKEMELRGYVKVKRISGSSIGSIIGFLYFMDALDEASYLYEMLLTDFKKEYNLAFIKKLKEILQHIIPANICEILYKKFYVTFNNVEKRKKIVKKTYKNVDDIIDTIIKSCFIPFLVDGNIVYKSSYMDGLNPYIFKTKNYNNNDNNDNDNNDNNNHYENRKVLFMNLNTFDKIIGSINVKNEKTNLHRILSGMLDIHVFFIKGSKTHMCSFVNDWNVSDHIYMYLRYLIEKMTIYSVYCLNYIIYKNVLQKIKKNHYFDLLFTYCKKYGAKILDKYCL